ncbi:MAG TPA: FAD-binding protein [Thermoanaerobaculia bacterium]|nr:FAD-binding protein [Thermoanaerobaculia bacterium]
MKCVLRGGDGFSDARRIRNARIYSNPSEICYCSNADDVIQALGKATPGGVRVRAGGHHHEGMCSGDNVLVIDVSNMNQVVVDHTKRTVRVGPGAKLGDIYNKVYEKGLLFPGGACGDVHVGGLVQGGGWGLTARRMGLTCDALDSIKIVIWHAQRREFQEIEVRGSEDPNHRLFWGVSGGGGGNFGVATEFVFNLEPIPGEKIITQFTATWKDRNLMRNVIDGWRKNVLGFGDDRLTTFCRLIAPGTESEGDEPSLIVGNFLGDSSELDTILNRLLPEGFCVRYDPVWPPAPAPLTANFTTPHYQPGPPGAKLSETCAKDAFFRHKVSSTYPTKAFDTGGVQGILDHINVAPLSGARRYISLHSLGLRVTKPNDRSCFAYRDKPFLIQYQAWWQKCELDEQCLDWVSDFRDDMHRRETTEGAFINFPDRDLVPATNQKELMRPYYRENLDALIALKQSWDPRGIFDFPMGIPRP